EKDFLVKNIAKDSVPKKTVSPSSQITGSTLLFSLSENEVITVNHLSKKVESNSESLLISKEAFGFSLPAEWLSARPAKLSPGDHLMILASAANRNVESGTSFLNLTPIKILKVESDKEGLPTRLLLDVQITEASNLLQAHANNMNLAAVILPLGSDQIKILKKP
ncbi:hypothetical protein HY224_00675, partial [Candidatus Uhrbacteria bacterium]|nr:hypothetical protein [Candidatus Uhrbacteria bacterium]